MPPTIQPSDELGELGLDVCELEGPCAVPRDDDEIPGVLQIAAVVSVPLTKQSLDP